MILRCTYEELTALRSGARGLLGEDMGVSAPPVLAPPESRARVEALVPHLSGDLSMNTLEQVRRVETAVGAIVEHLRAEMEAAVVAAHPADELAVSAYFEFAHAISVAQRLADITAEMSALVELVTGEPPTEETARTFEFPD